MFSKINRQWTAKGSHFSNHFANIQLSLVIILLLSYTQAHCSSFVMSHLSPPADAPLLAFHIIRTPCCSSASLLPFLTSTILVTPCFSAESCYSFFSSCFGMRRWRSVLIQKCGASNYKCTLL